MRIIAGTHRSRIIATLEGAATRPTSDKAKGAVFSSLGTYFDKGEMLDLFAGSGSMSYEAISRGMSHALLNDHSKAAIGIIKKNVKQFQMEQQCTIWNLDYAQALLRCHEEGRQFDLIFVDPPYALGKMEEIITLIDAYELLKDDGVLVVESLKEDQFAKQFGSLYQEKEAVYGISRMRYYRKGGNVDDRISGDV